MFSLLKKFQEFRDQLVAGDWKAASKTAYYILGVLLGEQPLPVAAGSTGEVDFRKCCEDVQNCLANPPSAGPGMALLIIALQQLGPVLIELLKRRLEDSNSEVQA